MVNLKIRAMILTGKREIFMKRKISALLLLCCFVLAGCSSTADNGSLANDLDSNCMEIEADSYESTGN